MNHDDEIVHSGIKGQKWGIRRYQNEDGSLTPEGRKRYGLKSQYSGMSDDELRKAINEKRTQNQYINLMTDASGKQKKREELKGLVKAAFKVGNKSVEVLDKSVGSAIRKSATEGMNKADAEMKEIDDKDSQAYKDASKAKDDYSNAKVGSSMAANSFKTATSGDVSDMVSKVVSKRVGKDRASQEQMAKAIRNVQEMSPEELKKTVDRMLLEKQYDEMLNPPKPSKVEKGKEVLEWIGNGLGIAASVLTIAFLAKQLKIKHEDDEFLAHYGVKGQKHGIRKYQNEDGSLTPEGYRHYGIDPNSGKGKDGELTIRKMNKYSRDVFKDEYDRARSDGYTRKEATKIAGHNTYAKKEKQYGYTITGKAGAENYNSKVITSKVSGILTGTAAYIGTGIAIAFSDSKIADSNIASTAVGTAAAIGAYFVGSKISREVSKNKKINRTFEGEDEFNDLMFKAYDATITKKDVEKTGEKIAQKYANRLKDIYDENGKLKPGKGKEAEKLQEEVYELLDWTRNGTLEDLDYDTPFIIVNKVVKEYNKYGRTPWRDQEFIKNEDGSDEFLAHYGVLGMKWGVRKYENRGGSYTQRGYEHWKDTENRYDSAHEKYKETKKEYKEQKKDGSETNNNPVTKGDVKRAKTDLKIAKNNLSKNYKQLKRDYAADQGKELYRSGKTITGNSEKLYAAGLIATGTAIASDYLWKTGRAKEAKYVAAAGVGLEVINGLLYAKNAVEAKKLRAYYAHSGHYV